MSRLINSGQYFYFNSLVQVLANILPVRILPREHMDAVENDAGYCQDAKMSLNLVEDMAIIRHK